MNVQPTFFIPIASDTLGNVDNAAIRKYCLDLKENNSGRTKSNKGGWQSDDIIGYVPELNQLFIEITDRINAFHCSLGYKQSLKQKIYNTWINVNGLGHFNAPHTHPGSIFSGVYYVDGQEDSGNLMVLNPNPFNLNDSWIEEYNTYTSAHWWFPPTPGTLIIFPSSLLHYVEPNRNTKERISISFNTYIVNDNDLS